MIATAHLYHRAGERRSRTALAFGLWLLAFLAAFPVGVRALDNTKTLSQFPHRIWNQEEGLLEPTIYSILQTREGYLWLGTQNGLVRFDGEHFRPVSLRRQPEEEPDLVRALAEDGQGYIWAGTIGSGLVRVGRGERTWYNSRNGMPSDVVTCVVRQEGTKLWVCTSQGLVEFENGPRKVWTTKDGLPSNRIVYACQATGETQWVATFDGGLARRQGGRFIPFHDRSGSIHGEFHSMRCAPDHSVWVGTNLGLFHVSESGVERFTVKQGLADDDVSTLRVTGDGTVWVGTQTGITRIRGRETSTFRTRDGLSHAGVLSILLDREGSLWVGTKNGLDQFTNSPVTPYTVTEGLPTNDIGPVLEDRDHVLWIGTTANGLIRFDGRRFQTFTQRHGLSDAQILSLANGADGDLWVGTARGLNHIRRGAVVGSYGIAAGLPGKEITALYFDQQSQLWVGTNKGIVVFNGRRFVAPQGASSVPPEGVVAIGGSAQSLVVSLESGRLFAWRNNAFSVHNPPDLVRPTATYYFDAAHRSLWMGTLGSGLVLLRDGSLTRLRVKDGLFDDQIFAILPDNQHNLWFASSKGIFRVSILQLDQFAKRNRKRVQSVPFNTGQLRFECQRGVQPGAWRTHDGRLWFSTNNGVVVVNPNELLPNTLPPPVQIETVFVNGKRREPDTTDVTLAPHEKNLSIRYAGLSFVNPEKVRFRYMLEGYDREYVEAGGRREAFYTNLPPGHFRFRVLACNSDGVWTERGAVLKITVQPRFYQRAWFFPLVGLLALVSALLGYRLRVRALNKRFELVLAERSRIARELHDTLLQGLSGITMQLQALWTRLPGPAEKRALSEIIKDAEVCQSEARQSLFNLRSARRTSSKFSENLARAAKAAVAGTPIRLVQHIAEAPYVLPPNMEFELLRIAREALSNAVRHAHPSTVELNFSIVPDWGVQLSVKDDGRGFDPEAEKRKDGHFGLVGIRERSAEIGGKLVINSSPGQGAEVSVAVPVSRKLRDRNGVAEREGRPISEKQKV